VYLIRGQGWYFSNGWATIRDRLRQAGIRAEDISDLAGNWAADDVLVDHQAGRLSGPLILVGHSRGARQSLAVAARLEKASIPVDLLLTVDVAVPQPVPSNVRQAVNLYLTRARFYPARPLQPSRNSDALIENIDLNAPGSPLDPKGLHHLNITDSTALQDYLFRRIVEAVRAAPDSDLVARNEPQ
jgi:thioesterase domain-containing protein